MKIRLKKEIKVDLNDVLKIKTQTYLVVSINHAKKGTLCHLTSRFNRKHFNNNPIIINDEDIVKDKTPKHV